MALVPTSYTNPLGITIPSTVTNPSALFMTGAGQVSYSQPTLPNTSLSWNGSAMVWIAPGSLPLGYNDITTASATLQVGVENVVSFATAVTLTLPATAAQGSLIPITTGAGVATIAQVAGQSIKGLANPTGTTPGVAGGLTIPEPISYLTLCCTTANTGYTLQSFTGSIGWT